MQLYYFTKRSRNVFIEIVFNKSESFQAVLSGCVCVAEWDFLTGAIQIFEECLPLAYVRLADVTAQEIEVS